MGDLQAAVPMLESAERLDPGALEYHMALASAYARLGRREDARRERQASLDMAGFTHSAVQNAESGTTVRATAKTSNASLPENR
jgi:Flp pilus assembly protein TadD